MKTVMIIPAKGSSTRLPGKNVKPFAGPHSLVAWSIHQGVIAKYVDEVWVSTDSEEIAEIGKKYGAKVMMRDYEDEVDTPGYIPVREWIGRMKTRGALEHDDMVICRLCTTPTLLPEDADNAILRWRWLNKHFGAAGIGIKAELRTLAIERKVVDGVSRGLPEDCRCENSYGIVQSLAAFGMNTADDMMQENQKIDIAPGEHPRRFYYNVQPWQMQDVDTQEEWDFAEVVAEHYILKGRDMMDVYKEQK